MRLNTQKKRKTKNGKTWFIAAAIALLTIFSTTFLLQSPALKKCDTSKHDLEECGCPMDTELIGKKNIVLIDASDKVPVSKFKDIEELINSFTKPSQTLEWLHKSKRVDKTSIYVLNVNSPVEMLPIASFCQLPPEISVNYFGVLTGKEINELNKSIISAISMAVSDVAKYTATKTSEIMRTIATTSSNSSEWKDGSNYVMVSDLYENSQSCGFFDKNSVPTFSSVSTTCKKWADIIAANMGSEKTTVAICRIHSKDMKPGLKNFWDDVFFEATGRKPIYTCDVSKISERITTLEFSK